MTEDNSQNRKNKNNYSFENDNYEYQITNFLEQINNHVSKGNIKGQKN